MCTLSESSPETEKKWATLYILVTFFWLGKEIIPYDIYLSIYHYDRDMESQSNYRIPSLIGVKCDYSRRVVL